MSMHIMGWLAPLDVYFFTNKNQHQQIKGPKSKVVSDGVVLKICFAGLSYHYVAHYYVDSEWALFVVGVVVAVVVAADVGVARQGEGRWVLQGASQPCSTMREHACTCFVFPLCVPGESKSCLCQSRNRTMLK